MVNDLIEINFNKKTHPSQQVLYSLSNVTCPSIELMERAGTECKQV